MVEFIDSYRLRVLTTAASKRFQFAVLDGDNHGESIIHMLKRNRTTETIGIYKDVMIYL